MPRIQGTDPGRVAPRNMDSRQWAEYISELRSQSISEGQSGYDSGVGFWLGLVSGTPKFSLGDSTAHKVTWDGTTLTIVGDITVSDGSITAAKLDVSELSAITADMGSITSGSIVLSEFIRSGQTNYDTGTGFWLGDDGGTPKFSIGDSAGNKLTWDGSTLTMVGDVSANYSKSDWGATQSFTPTWTGFSADPSGDFNYALSTDGRLAMMWTDSDMIGTSDAVTMTFSGLPAAIRPSGATVIRRPMGVGTAQTSTDLVPVFANIFPTGHASAGVVIFGTLTAAGGGARVVQATNQWENTGDKGILAGTHFVWPIG